MADDDSTTKRFSLESYVLWPAFALGTAATMGIVSVDILPVVNMGQVIVEFGDVEWTVGRIVALLALGIVLFNRDVGLRETNGFDLWAVYVTVGLIVAPPFFPWLEDTLASGIAGVVTWIVQQWGFTLTTWIN